MSSTWEFGTMLHAVQRRPLICSSAEYVQRRRVAASTTIPERHDDGSIRNSGSAPVRWWRSWGCQPVAVTNEIGGCMHLWSVRRYLGVIHPKSPKPSCALYWILSGPAPQYVLYIYIHTRKSMVSVSNACMMCQHQNAITDKMSQTKTNRTRAN